MFSGSSCSYAPAAVLVSHPLEQRGGMALFMLFLLVSSLATPQAFTMPDAIQIFNSTFHGKIKMVWIESPEFLPTKDELRDQNSNHRAHFWLQACGYTYLTAVLAGTAIMQIGIKVRRSQYALLVPSEKDTEKNPEKERISVVIVFFCTYTVCLVTVIWSTATNRLSKDTGLDWEVYWVLLTANCAWLLIQAAVLVATTTNEDYSVSAFLEASVFGTGPLFADSFDTLKDAMFGGLCWQSSRSELKIIGIVSWAYLALIHVRLFRLDEYVAEFQSSYLGVLYAPSKPKKSNNSSVAMTMMMMIYKQCTWTKRRVLLMENAVQALGSLVYLKVEGGSPLVVLVSLLVPLTQFLIGTIIYNCVARCVKEALASRFQQAATQNNIMKVRSEAKVIIEMEGQEGFFAMMKERFKDNPDLQFAVWEGLMLGEKLDLGPDGLKQADGSLVTIDDKDISELVKVLKNNPSLKQLNLGHRTIQDFSSLAQALKDNTNLVELNLNNTMEVARIPNNSSPV